MSTVATHRDFVSGEEWQYVILGQVAQVKGGKRLPKGEKFADTMTPFPYLRVTDFANFSIDVSDLRYLTPEIRATIKRYTISKNDVYISIAGSIGLTGMIPESLDGANLTENAAKLVLNDDVIAPRFLMYYLASEAAQTEIRGQTVKNAQPKLALARIASLEVPVPPKAEQRKIAAVLGLVQRAIEQQERLIALTTELKKALLHKLFTEGLRGEPQKQTEIGPVPESWQVVRLEEVCTFLSGGTPSKNKPEFWVGSIPWVSPKDMKMPRLNDVTDHISEAALEDGSSLAPAGSIFVVIRGMILAKDVPVALAEVPMAFNQDVKAVIPGPRILPAYLLYALVALKRNLFQKVGRSSHGTMTLMSSEVAQFLIPLPRRETQAEIAAAIETVERKHDAHCRKRTTLNDLFRNLLHQLMTAQIRVNDLDVDEILEETGMESVVGNGRDRSLNK